MICISMSKHLTNESCPQRSDDLGMVVLFWVAKSYDFFHVEASGAEQSQNDIKIWVCCL